MTAESHPDDALDLAGVAGVAGDADVAVRPVTAENLPAVAAVHLAARASAVALGHMPASPHPPATLEPYLRARLAEGEELWAALDPAGGPDGDVVVGYLRLTDTWLDDLYVHPRHAGTGIGSLLLDLAKALRPAGFGLWVFETNTPARDFYRRRGLVERERTDGSGNEERAPDVRMTWAG